jgi:hypothetical protein
MIGTPAGINSESSAGLRRNSSFGIRTIGNSIRVGQAHAAIGEPSAPGGCRQLNRGAEPRGLGLRSGRARGWS